MPRFLIAVCLMLAAALPAGADDERALTVGLDDGTLITGSDLIIVAADGASTSLFDLGHLKPEKLLSAEPQSASLRVVPVAPSDDPKIDKIREGPFNAPNPFPGNTLRITGGEPPEVQGHRLRFVVVHHGDWEDRLAFLKTKFYDGGAAGYRAYLDSHPGGRANEEAYELLAPTWAVELLARDVNEEFTGELLEFLDGGIKYVPNSVRKQFPDFVYRYIVVHRNSQLIEIFSDLWRDNPHQPEVQAIEGERQLAELFVANPGKSHMEMYGEIARLSNKFYASMELKLACARAQLEAGRYDEALRSLFLAGFKLERLQSGLPYGTGVVLEFIDTTIYPEQGGEIRRTLTENLPFAVTDDGEYKLTAV